MDAIGFCPEQWERWRRQRSWFKGGGSGSGPNTEGCGPTLHPQGGVRDTAGYLAWDGGRGAAGGNVGLSARVQVRR